MNDKISVLLVDDHSMLRKGVAVGKHLVTLKEFPPARRIPLQQREGGIWLDAAHLLGWKRLVE